MGSTVSIVNQTDHTLHISLKQLTPLHFQNFVKPNEVAVFNPGKVWFTIEAKKAEENNAYKNSDNVIPITLLTVGAVTAPLALIPEAAVASTIFWAFRTVPAMFASQGATGVYREVNKPSSVCMHGVYTGSDKIFTVTGGPRFHQIRAIDGTYIAAEDATTTGDEFIISEVPELPSGACPELIPPRQSRQ